MLKKSVNGKEGLVAIGLLTEWQNLYILMIIEILGLGLFGEWVNHSKKEFGFLKLEKFQLCQKT